MTGTAASSNADGGAGGAATTAGDFTATGQDGQMGFVLTGARVVFGSGGGAMLGRGGVNAVYAGAAGTAGENYGGGGAGGQADATSTNRAGGAGGAGIVIVREYF
jgi:hypothetical protein